MLLGFLASCLQNRQNDDISWLFTQNLQEPVPPLPVLPSPLVAPKSGI